MKSASSFRIALATALSFLAGAASSAWAEQSGPALGGPTVPGICLLSQEAVFANAKVGQAATARLRQLAVDASTPLTAERQAIEADAKRLADGQATLSAAQLASRRQSLNERAQAYQSRTQTLSRQVEATKAKAAQQIAQAAQPIISQAYHARNCGLLLNRDAVIGGNLSGDLTPDVVNGLDAKMTTITFDLEPPPAPPAQQRQ
jgi:Skp family chaperone for outer membrane proteins